MKKCLFLTSQEFDRAVKTGVLTWHEAKYNIQSLLISIVQIFEALQVLEDIFIITGITLGLIELSISNWKTQLLTSLLKLIDKVFDVAAHISSDLTKEND